MGDHAAAIGSLAALALLVLAAVTDVRCRRIPNALVLPALALALIAAPRVDDALLGALAASLPFFALSSAFPGAMGMGDAKLTAAAGALCGLAGLGQLIVTIALLGGGLAIAVRIARGPRATFAYGPAIATGAVLVIAF